MKLATLALVAAGMLCAAPAFAANERSVPYSGPMTHVVYDMATHTVTPAMTKGGPVLVYNNTTTNGYYYKPTVGKYVMDWGTLAAAPYNCITSFDFAYVTSSTAAAGVDIRIRVFSGATGYGTQGTVAFDQTFTGLPGSTTGSPTGWLITIPLSPGFCFDLPDGPIGYAYEVFDTLTGPYLIGPPNEVGVANAFDRYITATNAYDGTYWFGGTPFASFYFALTGWESFINFGAACAGTGGFLPNLALTGCACPGNTVNLTISNALGGAPAALILGAFPGAIPLDPYGVCFLDIGAPFIMTYLGPLPGAGPGGGGLAFAGVIPPTSPAGTAYIQVVIQDAGNLITTNGIQIDIP